METFGKSCWHYFGSFFGLKRFLDAFFASCCICHAFCSFFSRLGVLQPRFWSPKLAICWHIFRSWRHFWTWCRDCCKKNLLAFTFCFSFPQCSAAVRAQHIRRLPKGCRACRTVIISSTCACLQSLLPELGFRFLAQRPSPHPFVPSPGPARTAALRPQFALEASKSDFFAFQISSCFLLAFFLEKTAKIEDFGLPKPSPNPLKTPSKSMFQKT